MHIQTHILAGWCFGNLFKFCPRERFFCMLVSFLPDFDGAGKIIDLMGSTEYYHDYHHIFGHNLLVGLIISAALTIFSTSRLKAFFVYIGLFHLHMLMDFFGSGPLWEIYYLWPFSREGFLTEHSWEFFSWQNMLTAAILIVWTVWIIIKKQRTPLEYPMPKLDKQLVDIFTSKTKKS